MQIKKRTTKIFHMIQYLLECIAFQLVFLIIYDFFLKRETFFQWNRVYLIGTYILSMVLPWVKIEALKTTVPEKYNVYPEFLWNTNVASTTVIATEGSLFTISWEEGILYGGMLLATLYFGYKLYQIQKLRKEGSIQYFPNFTQIVVKNSELAFSFFKSIFLGDKVVAREHEGIIKHELVHIEQKHSWDLLFFELMRIVGWFNPLVYVYQSRISELHEFIADAQVAKTDKNEQYQLLLSKVFQTQNISFINQFFKTSLIKKRIVMLQKARSKRIWKLKYLAMVPILAGILFYTSCERELNTSDEAIETFIVGDIENLTEEEHRNAFSRLVEISEQEGNWAFVVKDKNSTVTFTKAPEGSFVSGTNDVPMKAKMHIESKVLSEDFDLFSYKAMQKMMRTRTNKGIPFMVVEEAPIFPGCEDAEDPRECFQNSIQKHISKNFRYPQEAQEQGIQGRVNVMFTIAKDGSIQSVKKRGPHPLLEEEVVRIISKLPQMSPGKNKGQPVDVPFSIPVTFKLEGSGSSQNALDPEYEKLKSKQISELPNKIQMEYKGAVPFATVEHVPVFPGCEDAVDRRACFQKSMQKHIGKNFNYPREAQERGVQGRVNIMFLIGADGSIRNIAKRGPDKLLEDEAVRIISNLPRMIPGSHEGENVDVPFSIPITFKLQ